MSGLVAVEPILAGAVTRSYIRPRPQADRTMTIEGPAAAERSSRTGSEQSRHGAEHSATRNPQPPGPHTQRPVDGKVAVPVGAGAAIRRSQPPAQPYTRGVASGKTAQAQGTLKDLTI